MMRQELQIVHISLVSHQLHHKSVCCSPSASPAAEITVAMACEECNLSGACMFKIVESFFFFKFGDRRRLCRVAGSVFPSTNPLLNDKQWGFSVMCLCLLNANKYSTL